MDDYALSEFVRLHTQVESVRIERTKNKNELNKDVCELPAAENPSTSSSSTGYKCGQRSSALQAREKITECISDEELRHFNIRMLVLILKRMKKQTER